MIERMFSDDNGYVVERRWQRLPIHIPVKLVVPPVAYATHANGSELNEGGMRLFAVHEMRLGTQVAVEFTPPASDESIRLCAAVRNRRRYHYGLEFLAANAMDKKQVQRYCNALRVLRAATQPFPSGS